MKFPLPPGVRTDRKRPRVAAAIVTAVAFIFCIWGTWELSRRTNSPVPRMDSPQQRTPEELSTTTLVKRMVEQDSSPIIFSQTNAGR